MADDPDQIELKLPGFGRLRDPAKQKLLEVLTKHGVDVLGEASRLELRWRTEDDGEPEITARDITDASVFMQRVSAKKKTTRTKACEIVAFSSTFIGGVFGNMITTPVGAVGFAACALVGVIAYTSRGDE